MKIKMMIGSFILVLLMVSAVYADSTTSGSSTSTTTSTSTSSSASTATSIDTAALVYVSNVTMDPETFFPGDEGTVTVTLTNGGTTAIGLSHPDLISNHLNVQASDWDGMSFVGAGSTITYSVRFTVKQIEGSYPALFTIGTQSGNAIHYPVEIVISSNSLKAAVTSKPTSFAPEAEQNVTLTLMNTRDGEIKNVVITPVGSGIESDPTTDLISTINPCSSTDVTFGITPHQASNLTFDISYQNGDNTHTTNVVLPIDIGQDKTAAVPVLNNVVLTTSGSDYDITGDITNAGISDAYGVVVTVGSPATGTGTYPEYAIGSIASDDSGSFELTFTSSDLSAVPVIISWKDSEGNDYSLTKTLDLATSSGTGSSTATSSSKTSSSSSSSMSGGPGGMGGGPGGNMGGPGGSSSSSTTSLFTSSKGAGISSFYPIIGAVILLIAGIVLWKKRKWISLKLKKQQ
ncbi:MAG: hypothetical protein ABSE74_01970 [Methanoregula sp.]|jgi:hypothetical protein